MNGEIISIENAKKTAKYEKALRVIKMQKDEINELKRIINKAIEYINEMCLCSDGYADYGDDLNPEHIVNILQGKEK